MQNMKDLLRSGQCAPSGAALTDNPTGNPLTNFFENLFLQPAFMQYYKYIISILSAYIYIYICIEGK